MFETIAVAAFEYGLPGVAMLIAFAAIRLVRDVHKGQREIVAWIKEREEADEKVDEDREKRLAHERQSMLSLIESILDRQHQRYAELVTTLKTGMADLVQSYQGGIAEISAQVTAAYQAAEQTVAQVQVERAARFDQIDQRFDTLDTSITDAATATHQTIEETNRAQTEVLLETLRNIGRILTSRTEAIETLLKDRSSAKETGALLALLQEKLAAVHAAVNELIVLSKEGPDQAVQETDEQKPTEEPHARASQSSTGLSGDTDGTGGGSGTAVPGHPG